MNEMFNGKLHQVVKQLYEELISEFGNQDFHSEEFLSSFPYRFIEDEGERHRRITDAAVSPAFHQEAQKCIDACYSNSAGGDLEFYLCRAVEDFLNYIIPRTVALSEGAELFERYYRHFDSSIYGKSCLVTVVAIIRDIWDHSGAGSTLPPGFRLSWLMNGPKLTVPYTRGRAVPFFEIKKSARPIGRGRNLTEESGFYVLEYSASIPKKRDILGAAYHLQQDVITKFLLAARIKTFSTAHSDYRGFRMLGHLSAYSMNLTHYPDDVMEEGEGRSLQEVDGMAIERLLTKILPQPLSKFAVINQKIEDAMRRKRTAIRNDERAQKMNEVDQLLDYFQVLEAIVPAEGSQYISLYAARVLTPPNSAPNQGFELFRFIKDMHTIRNHVIHGRVGDVLSGKVKTHHKLDIPRFRHIIYSLASLYIMNGPLREFATRLALGENVDLERDHEANEADWLKRRKSAASRNANTVFW